MERIKTILSRYRQTAFLFLLGLAVIAYLAIGAVYLQQAPVQRDLEEQIIKLSAILRNPIPDSKPLQAELAAADLALTPIEDDKLISMLLELARGSGIDTSEAGARFRVPVALHGVSGTYELVSFRGMHVQGARDAVLDFLRMLDSDEALQPPGSPSPRSVVRTVTRVTFADIDVTKVGEEAERAIEFRSIQDAVLTMMTANNITSFFYPVSASLGKATRNMGDDPSTIGPDAFEGFPDFTAKATELFPVGKGYTGNGTPKNGFLLWEHDKINSDNNTLYTTVNYTANLKTKYYYTVEQDGKVRQWDRTTIATAIEYPDNNPTKMELIVNLDLDIYVKTKQ